LHPKRLVRTLVVVKLNPVADHTAGVLQSLETVPMRALLLQGPDDTLDHTVLLRTVWRDDLLANGRFLGNNAAPKRTRPTASLNVIYRASEFVRQVTSSTDPPTSRTSDNFYAAQEAI